MVFKAPQAMQLGARSMTGRMRPIHTRPAVVHNVSRRVSSPTSSIPFAFSSITTGRTSGDLFANIAFASASVTARSYGGSFNYALVLRQLTDSRDDEALQYAARLFCKDAGYMRVYRRGMRARRTKRARSTPRVKRSIVVSKAARRSIPVPAMADVVAVKKKARFQKAGTGANSPKDVDTSKVVWIGRSSTKPVSGRRLRMVGGASSAKPSKVVSKRTHGRRPRKAARGKGNAEQRGRVPLTVPAGKGSKAGKVRSRSTKPVGPSEAPKALHAPEGVVRNGRTAVEPNVHVGVKGSERFSPTPSAWRFQRARQLSAMKGNVGLRIVRDPKDPNHIVVERSVRGVPVPVHEHYHVRQDGKMIFAGWELAAVRRQQSPVEPAVRALQSPMPMREERPQSLGLGKSGGESNSEMPYFKAGKRDLGEILASLVLEQLRDDGGPESIDENQLWNTFNNYVFASGYAEVEAALSREDWLNCLRSSLLFAVRNTPAIDDNGLRPIADVQSDVARVLGISVDGFYAWERFFDEMDAVSEHLFAADAEGAGLNGVAQGNDRWLKALGRQIAMRSAEELGGHDADFGLTREQEIAVQWAVARVSIIPGTEERIEHAQMIVQALARRNKHEASRFLANIIRHSVLNENRAESIRRDDDTAMVEEAG